MSKKNTRNFFAKYDEPVQNNKITVYLSNNKRHDDTIGQQNIREKASVPKIKRLTIKLQRLTKSQIEELQAQVANAGKRLDHKQHKSNNVDGIAEKKVKEPSIVTQESRLTRSKARAAGIIVPKVNLEQITKNNKRKLKTNDSLPPAKKLKPNVEKGSNLNQNKPEKFSTAHTSVDKPNTVVNTQGESSVQDPSVLPINMTQTVARIDFSINEVVWAKIKGSPHWPAKVLSFPSDRTVEVFWFNDYRKTKIFRTQMFKFLTHFEQFAQKFDDCVGLKTAAQEGLIC